MAPATGNLYRAGGTFQETLEAQHKGTAHLRNAISMTGIAQAADL